MLPVRGVPPLSYRPLSSSEHNQVLALNFSAAQIEQFLGSLHDMVATVRHGPAHHMIGIEEGSQLIGFYAIHPDRRDGACWWLGWFGIDQRWQGGGRGGRAIAAILSRLRQLAACREVRLLVCPSNAAALRLYRRAGFELCGLWRRTGELIMRCVLPPSRPSGEVPARFWANAILMHVIEARTCRMGVPVAAQLHGEVAFPP